MSDGNGHVAGGCCEGKLPYATKGKAIMVVKRMERRNQIKKGWCDHARLEAYHCTFCHHWHIGQDIKRRGYV